MRTDPSAADRQLIEQLGAQGLTASPAQLERWRHAGLLPRNPRHGRGRGLGSVATAEPQAVEIAAALARHTRQGRDLRLAVVDWFGEAGRNTSLAPPVPEPPDKPVNDAIVWVLEKDAQLRLIRMARSASTEKERDAFYDEAENFVRRRGTPVLRPFDPNVARQALLSGVDLPDENTALAEEREAALIQLTAGLGMGVDEVTPNLFAKAMIQLGTVPSSLTLDELSDALADPAKVPRLQAAMASAGAHDALEVARQADAAQLRRARTVAYGLAGLGGMYLFHGLLMPDTPGLTALRTNIDELGVRDLLVTLSMSMTTTASFASHVVSCLTPWMSKLYETILAQVEQGPGLLHGTDDEHTAEKFMHDWMGELARLRSEYERPSGSKSS